MSLEKEVYNKQSAGFVFMTLYTMYTNILNYQREWLSVPSLSSKSFSTAMVTFWMWKNISSSEGSTTG